ncbi:MAG: hypothetical protein NVSMB55_03500 [Mycobacteriales bacterium]
MGSGLILLVIVGAWLAVLVPMALRSHDASTSLSSVDRFSDAMRVLSRREQTGRGSMRSLVMPSPPSAPRLPVPVAVRRRRVLLGLVGVASLTLVMGLLGAAWSYGLFAVFGGLSVAYVVRLRKQAVRRQALLARQRARQSRRAGIGPGVARTHGAAVGSTGSGRVAGIPDRMPIRPEPLSAPLPAPASRYEDPHPVAATWDSPAFPVPTYVTAPVAPPRPSRVLDLTRPGQWTADLEAGDVGMSILAEDDELDDILDGRRASGDW